MSRPILKIAATLLILAATVLIFCNWREVVDWAYTTLGADKLLDWVGGPGGSGDIQPLA